MKYKSYVTDLHVNLHPDQMNLLKTWYEHSKDVLDFFTLAYYPYEMKKFKSGMETEGLLESKMMLNQWEELKSFFEEKNKKEEYISFIGYEWQGSCLDGDHNVYFKQEGPILHPNRYVGLKESLEKYEAFAIPHHLAYQIGHRGKNWETHDEFFSPFSEIFSSHGSSEQATTDIEMLRHIHMGPRTGGTSVYDGLKKGYHTGIIASGDNHVVPGMVNNGRAGVWSKDYTKNSIWEAFSSRRVYGFTKNKIKLWMDIDGNPMGSIIKKNNSIHGIEVDVTANNKINRIELIKNGYIDQVITNCGNKLLKLEEDSNIIFKFKVECGWGPDLKIYPDLHSKEWQGKLHTEGKIISVEKDYNSFGMTYDYEDDQMVAFNCISHKTTQSGKWMGNSPVNSEGFIFEIEAPLNSDVMLEINGCKKIYKVKDLLENTDLIVFYEEAVVLAKERFSFDDYYRSDPFYHNAYKVRVNQGAIKDDFSMNVRFNIEEDNTDSFYLVKVYQVDGQVAWSSPVWLEV